MRNANFSARLFCLLLGGGIVVLTPLSLYAQASLRGGGGGGGGSGLGRLGGLGRQYIERNSGGLNQSRPNRSSGNQGMNNRGPYNNRENYNQRDSYDDNFDGYRNSNGFDSNNFQPVPVTPPAPPKPQPKPSAVVAVRSFAANPTLATPSYPPRTVVNRLRDELADVSSTQLNTVEDLLKKSGVDRRAVDALKQVARRTSRDEFSLRDFEKAIAERNPESAASSGELLNLNVDQLANTVLYVSCSKLRGSHDAALAEDDARTLREFRNEVREFRNRLTHSQVERGLRDATAETVDALLATMEARVDLQASLEASKEHQEGAPAPEWNSTDELSVILDPRIAAGTVYYVTPDCILAGSRINGRASVVRSTLASAFGPLSFDAPAAGHVIDNVSTLSAPTAVTFINPAENGQPFAFQLNGFDFVLEPGTLQEFTNADAAKLETFLYAQHTGGEKTSGFKLVEQDGSPIKKAFFYITRTGDTWNCVRKTSLPLVRDSSSAPVAKTSVLYLRNNTDRPITYKLLQREFRLQPGQGHAIDAAQLTAATTVVEFVPSAGGKAVRNSLSRGNAYQFADRDGALVILASKPYTLTIDNETSPFEFKYALNGEACNVPPFESRQHTFTLPPSDLLVSFASGPDRSTRARCQLDQTYYVGLAPGLQFDLYTDRAAAHPQLSELRAAQLERDEQLASLPPVPPRGIAAAPAPVEAPPAEPAPAPSTPAPSSPVAATPAPVVADTAAASAPATAPAAPAVEIAPAERKPQAHVLAVGVSKYANANYNLKFANRDAEEFAQVFGEQSRDFYDRVNVTLLCDEKATSLAVKKALNAIARDAQNGDVVVLFFSSHGLSENKRYYLGTHDLDPKDLLSTAVKHSDVVEAIEILTDDKQCQVIVFIDSCNSGALTNVVADAGDKGGASLGSIGQSKSSHDLSNKIADSGKGCLVFASSADGQVSIEDPKWQHGAFTKAFLDAITSAETDQDGDGVIGVIELDPAMNRIVGDLTNGKQRIYVSWPQSVKNFPLIRLAK